MQEQPHTLPAQVAVLLAPAGHGLPQAPQLAGDAVMFTSQPLLQAPSQFAYPPVQVGVALAPAVHATLQLPQFAGVLRLVSQPFMQFASQFP